MSWADVKVQFLPNELNFSWHPKIAGITELNWELQLNFELRYSSGENWLQPHVAEVVFCKAVIFLWTYQLSCSAVKLQSKVAVRHLLAKSKLTERPSRLLAFPMLFCRQLVGKKGTFGLCVTTFYLHNMKGLCLCSLQPWQVQSLEKQGNFLHVIENNTPRGRSRLICNPLRAFL